MAWVMVRVWVRYDSLIYNVFVIMQIIIYILIVLQYNRHT